MNGLLLGGHFILWEGTPPLPLFLRKVFIKFDLGVDLRVREGCFCAKS